MQKQGLPSNPNSPLWEEARHWGQCCCITVSQSTAHRAQPHLAEKPLAALSCHPLAEISPLEVSIEGFQLSVMKPVGQSPDWRQTWYCPILFSGTRKTFSFLCSNSSFCEMVVATVFLYMMVGGDVQMHILSIFREISLWQKPISTWQKYQTCVIFFYYDFVFRIFFLWILCGCRNNR